MSLERVLLRGDLSKLSEAQRLEYYDAVCAALGLNPLTKPCEYLLLPGRGGEARLVLYVNADGCDQLRAIHGISVDDLDVAYVADKGLITATCKGHVIANGRTDMARGVVAAKGLTGEAFANAVMKAETKSKRRFTLSIVGLGALGGTDDVPADAEGVPSGALSTPQVSAGAPSAPGEPASAGAKEKAEAEIDAAWEASAPKPKP